MPTDETFDAGDIVDGVLDHCAGMEITDTTKIITTTVEQTIAYVVEWLYERGNTPLSEILESIGEL